MLGFLLWKYGETGWWRAEWINISKIKGFQLTRRGQVERGVIRFRRCSEGKCLASCHLAARICDSKWVVRQRKFDMEVYPEAGEQVQSAQGSLEKNFRTSLVPVK